ncbi:hypothetical protein [Nonomuraea sp. MG754425]|uniref:hypothetical protein n=1 Tax=Nonomuraea sp. MG754425 TaxID=2570319 RepID=UPI001F36420B|nr:hypothetical protein [Nonomuraea sp. MG754425]
MWPFIHTQQTGAPTGRKLFTPHDRKEQISRATMLRLMHAPLIGPALGKIMNGSDMNSKQFDVAAV